MTGFLTTKQAAKILGVDERTVYYYLRDQAKNDFPEPTRFGRTLMWEEAPLRDWRTRHPARRRGDSPPA